MRADSTDCEGIDRLELMERLLVMWKRRDDALRATDDMLRDIESDALAHRQVSWACPGGDRAYAMDSVEPPA